MLRNSGIGIQKKSYPRIYTFLAAVSGVFDGRDELDNDGDGDMNDRTNTRKDKNGNNGMKGGPSFSSPKGISNGFFKNSLLPGLDEYRVNVWDCEGSLTENCKIITEDRLGKETQRLKKALKGKGKDNSKDKDINVDMDAISIDQLVLQLSEKPSKGLISGDMHLNNIMGYHYTQDMNIRNMHEYVSIKPYTRSSSSGGSFHRNNNLLIDILIMNTEGFDGEVLRGAGNVIYETT